MQVLEFGGFFLDEAILAEHADLIGGGGFELGGEFDIGTGGGDAGGDGGAVGDEGFVARGEVT